MGIRLEPTDQPTNQSTDHPPTHPSHVLANELMCLCLKNSSHAVVVAGSNTVFIGSGIPTFKSTLYVIKEFT